MRCDAGVEVWPEMWLPSTVETASVLFVFLFPLALLVLCVAFCFERDEVGFDCRQYGIEHFCVIHDASVLNVVCQKREVADKLKENYNDNCSNFALLRSASPVMCGGLLHFR